MNHSPMDSSALEAQARRRDRPVLLAVLVLLLVAPLLVYPVFMTKLLCFALLATAFNLLVGQTGLLSFGHAMFFGGASYFAGYALKVWQWPTEAALLLGCAYAAFAGLIVGLLSIRRQGIYFAMITLAMAQMFFYFCVAAPFTGGDDGISAIPRQPLFGIPITDDISLYYVVLVFFVLAFALVYRVMHSPFGQVLRAIRDNDARAVSLGYRVQRYKLLAFVLSATLAGLAGALKVLVFRLATLVDVGWGTSGEVILMTLVGGIGTVLGPLVGAAFILTMQNQLQGLSQWVPIVQGSIFVAVVLLLPMGIVGTFQHWLPRRRGAAGAAAASGDSADRDTTARSTPPAR